MASPQPRLDEVIQSPSVAEPEEQALLAPVVPGLSYEWVHQLSQNPLRPRDAQLVTTIRRSATIRRGTRMIKLFSARQLGAFLHGRRPHGFCYREFDLAELRGPADLALLVGDALPTDRAGASMVFGLRWRATDPADYHIPFAAEVGEMPSYAGMTSISPHDRLGPPVLGTGFAPSNNHLVPEFVTADMADLPLPAGSSLVAFAADGTEISLYLYIPEQRAWTRMFGPQHKHLLGGVPEISTEQEYVQSTTDHSGGSTLLGRYQDEVYEAIADPPGGFRVLSRMRAARYPVEAVARRTRYVTWHDTPCTVVRAEGDWLRLRLCRPDRVSASQLGMQCIERGVYESWASMAEVGGIRDIDQPYPLS